MNAALDKLLVLLSKLEGFLPGCIETRAAESFPKFTKRLVGFDIVGFRAYFRATLVTLHPRYFRAK